LYFYKKMSLPNKFDKYVNLKNISKKSNSNINYFKSNIYLILVVKILYIFQKKDILMILKSF